MEGGDRDQGQASCKVGGGGRVRGGVRGQGESARVQREGCESENSAPFAEDLILRTLS